MSGATQLTRFFGTVERLNVVLALLAIVVTHLAVGTGPILTGVAVGAALGVLNLRGISWLAGRFLAAPKRSRGIYAVMFGAKLIVVMTIIWVVLTYVDAAPLGFLIGASTLMPAILIATFWLALQPVATEARHPTPSTEQHV